MQQDASGWITGKLDKESDRNIWHVECLASEVSCATKRDIDKAWHGHRLLPCNKMPSQQDKALNLDSQSILKAGKGQFLDYVLNSRIPYNLGPCSKISQKILLFMKLVCPLLGKNWFGEFHIRESQIQSLFGWLPLPDIAGVVTMRASMVWRGALVHEFEPPEILSPPSAPIGLGQPSPSPLGCRSRMSPRLLLMSVLKTVSRWGVFWAFWPEGFLEGRYIRKPWPVVLRGTGEEGPENMKSESGSG